MPLEKLLKENDFFFFFLLPLNLNHIAWAGWSNEVNCCVTGWTARIDEARPVTLWAVISLYFQNMCEYFPHWWTSWVESWRKFHWYRGLSFLYLMSSHIILPRLKKHLKFVYIFCFVCWGSNPNPIAKSPRYQYIERENNHTSKNTKK